MVSPFKPRQAPNTATKFLGGLMRKLDLASPNPEGAELEIVNHLARAGSHGAVNPGFIQEQYTKFNLKESDILAIQAKLIKSLVRHMMTDDSLSAEERQDLKTFIKAIGISGAKAMEICKSIGTQIYFERLSEAMADGVISDSERKRLNNIKTIFAIKTEVPQEGVDHKVATIALYREYAPQLRQNIETAEKAIAFLDASEEENDNLTNINAYCNLRDKIEAFGSDMEDYLADLENFYEQATDLDSANDDDSVELADVYESAKNTERELLDSIRNYKEFNFQREIDKVHEWKTWNKRKIDADNKAEFVERKAHNSRVVKARGFDPKGSPKQKAWVYDIIAEQCFTSPFWEFVEAKIANAQTDEDLMYVRFVNWLKIKPCGWWIGKFQDTDLEAVFNNFKATEFK